MIAYMSLAPQITPIDGVIESVQNQDVIDSVYIHITNAYYPRDDYRRYHAIAANLKEIFHMAWESGAEYFALCNSTRLLQGDEYQYCWDFIKNNSSYAMVRFTPGRIHRSRHRMHLGTETSIYRTEAMKDLKYDMKGNRNCNSLALCKELRLAGWDYDYAGPYVSG